MLGKHSVPGNPPELEEDELREAEAAIPEEPENDIPDEIDEPEEAPRRRRGSDRHPPEPPRPVKRRSFFKMLITDIILCGIILCVFAFFHHVYPRFTAKNAETPTPVSVVSVTPTPEAQPEPTPAPENGEAQQSVEAVPEITPEPEATPEPTPEVTPEPRELTWREKFADKFTDEVELCEDEGMWHYSDSDLCVNVSKIRTSYEDIPQSNIYIADIYVADINAFKTCFASGDYSYYYEESAEYLSNRAGAIVAINADYADAYPAGFLVRNGKLYFDEVTTEDICVLFYDGTVKNYAGGSYSVDDIVGRSPWQSFKFGPALVTDGVIPETFNTSNEIAWENPRAAFGYYEPGHYCLVVVDGRQTNSRGLEINRLAQFMLDLGCENAYNLDGGASAQMTFNCKVISSPSGSRKLGDILCAVPLTTDKEDAE